MKDNGKMISDMEKEKKHGLMELVLKEITIIIRKMVEESFNGWMEIAMLDNFDKIEKVVKE